MDLSPWGESGVRPAMETGVSLSAPAAKKYPALDQSPSATMVPGLWKVWLPGTR